MRTGQPLAISVYPNPTAQALQVQLPPGLTGARLEIGDAQGRTVLRTSLRPDQVVDVRGLARGLYLSRVVAGSRVGTAKFVKAE